MATTRTATDTTGKRGTAKKTTTKPPAKQTPAKRATARPAAKKTTPAPTKTATPRPAHAEPDRINLHKNHPPAPTLVDLRPPLRIRRRVFVGPHKPTELAAIRAALASAAARLPIPVRAWNGPTAHLHDGTTLTHTPAYATTDQPPQFIAHIPCPHGATHEYLIRSARDLAGARAVTSLCQVSHGSPDQDTAIRHGAPAVAQPKPPAAFQLREGVRRAQALHDDTEPLNRDDIDAGLTARADTDSPKEHPQP
ncbi:hypothetical protein ACIP2X_38205 [Streptomyces sp. NPDC089424]|uniref:hypothetical protein n=1 Tax=Streptomyces sp. NPDC089424 TaxID=3365917 RepID=UPI0037F40FF8